MSDNGADDPRERRLARNEAIRQRNRARNAENERNADKRPAMTTVVMNPCKPLPPKD